MILCRFFKKGAFSRGEVIRSPYFRLFWSFIFCSVDVKYKDYFFVTGLFGFSKKNLLLVSAMLKLYSYYFEEIIFKFAFGKNEGAENPLWLESEDFPPLSPRQAIAVSKLTVLEMLGLYPYADPQFHACALKKGSESENGWWYYDIEWMVYPPEYGDRSVINVPVMLNGQVPSYELFKYEDRSSAWKT